MTTGTAVATRPVDVLKKVLNENSIQQQFKNAMRDNAGPFIASIIDLYSSDTALQECEPGAVVRECLKAASLKLLINKSLGHAYIVPYKEKGKQTPHFQIGYKGYIQLAQRTGEYKFINAGPIYEGMVVKTDILTGSITIEGESTSDKPIGYFCYFELLNGFSKGKYMSVDEVLEHAKKFSRAYQYDLREKKQMSTWSTNFEAMAIKTVVLQLVPKYGPMSTEFIRAMDTEIEAEFEEEKEQNANKETLVIPEGDENPKADPETGEVIEEQQPALDW